MRRGAAAPCSLTQGCCIDHIHLKGWLMEVSISASICGRSHFGLQKALLEAAIKA